MNLNTLKDVYVDQLKDMYSAEKQLTEALPKMARAALNPSLRTFANSLGYSEAARTLQGILDQEYAADQKLDDLAEGLHGQRSLNTAAKN